LDKKSIVLSAIATEFKKIVPAEELGDILAIISKKDPNSFDQLLEVLEKLK
jgi:hypothetical protein